MVFKIIALVAVGFLVYVIFFKKSREDQIKKNKNEEITDTMVECPKCGVYTSKDDAILSNGRYYCSKECLR